MPPLVKFSEHKRSRINNEKHRTVMHTAISPIRANLLISLDSLSKRRQNQIAKFVDCLELRIIPDSGLSSFWLLAMLEPK